MDTAIDITRLSFEPLIAWPFIWALGVFALIAWGVYLTRRGRAWLTRGAGLSLLAAALANPNLVEETREPLSSVAAIVVDRSESMEFGRRTAAADRALEGIEARLGEDESLEFRVIETDRRLDGTNLFAALEGLMADVPRERVAGAVFITDGQVHDTPSDPDRVADLGPIHGLIVGDPDRGDRRIEIVDGPSFGIVSEDAEYILRVDDPDGGRIPVSISVNGGVPMVMELEAGRDTPVTLEIERRGQNIIVVETPPGREELTLANNRTAASLSGVRDRLRVLLITGRPNAAGRVWRDLLKSDPQVDLVHFTILRPPYKQQDITPIEELALIPFPTDELFEEKLNDFDLIIFDQYERRTVITQSYLANMARYVDDGGALMIIAGEPFAGPASLARTPLAAVLPAVPTGGIHFGRFVPGLTDAGTRHTVTAPLAGLEWGSWLRAIEANAEAGDVLLSGPDGGPLLLLDRVGDGRVGLLLSDQIWLWARGHDGGGPFSELIRRLVHWLMKEPDLEERQLTLAIEDGIIVARLRTLADSAAPLTIETPEGELLELDWQADPSGLFVAQAPVDQLGLYRASAGGLEAIILNGPANPKEYADLTSVEDVLAPVAEATSGGVFRLRPDGTGLPDIRRVGRSGGAAGAGWLGLRERDAYAVRASASRPLMPGLPVAALALLLLMISWRREGR